MFAVRMNPEPLVAQTLIELGANVAIMNLAGQRAVDMVSSNPNPAYPAHPVLRLLTPIVPLAQPTIPSTTQQPSAPPPPPAQAGCCRVCRTGRACGDSCISRSNACHRGQGCACQGVSPTNPLVVTEVRAMHSLIDVGELASTPCDLTNVALGGKVGVTVL